MTVSINLPQTHQRHPYSFPDELDVRIKKTLTEQLLLAWKEIAKQEMTFWRNPDSALTDWPESPSQAFLDSITDNFSAWCSLEPVSGHALCDDIEYAFRQLQLAGSAIREFGPEEIKLRLLGAQRAIRFALGEIENVLLVWMPENGGSTDQRRDAVEKHQARYETLADGLPMRMAKFFRDIYVIEGIDRIQLELEPLFAIVLEAISQTPSNSCLINKIPIVQQLEWFGRLHDLSGLVEEDIKSMANSLQGVSPQDIDESPTTLVLCKEYVRSLLGPGFEGLIDKVPAFIKGELSTAEVEKGYSAQLEEWAVRELTSEQLNDWKILGEEWEKPTEKRYRIKRRIKGEKGSES